MSENEKPKSSRTVATSVALRMKERMADPRAIWGLPHAFRGLNTLTGGIHKTEMTILVSRPSVGKTQVMVQETDAVDEYLQTAEGQAEHQGGVIKLVLCESTAEVFYRRWACLRAGVSQRRVLDGSIREHPAKAERFLAELRGLAQRPIEILDGARSLADIVAFLTTGNTAWWALDHIQKCPLAPNRPNDNSVGALTLISNGLNEVARLKAPGLVLAHTTREVDKREDRQPRMGDIKGASSLEGDARVVLGLYRESIYLKIPEEEANFPQRAALLVLKQNEGESNRTVELTFHPRRGMFEDVSHLMEGGERDDD